MGKSTHPRQVLPAEYARQYATDEALEGVIQLVPRGGNTGGTGAGTGADTSLARQAYGAGAGVGAGAGAGVGVGGASTGYRIQPVGYHPPAHQIGNGAGAGARKSRPKMSEAAARNINQQSSFSSSAGHHQPSGAMTVSSSMINDLQKEFFGGR